MDLETFSTALEESTTLPVAYHHFQKGKAPALPYVIYYETGREDDRADNGVWYKITEVTIELYADRKSPDVEQTVEDFLESLEIPYDKMEDWIDEEKMYMNVYDIEITGDKNG